MTEKRPGPAPGVRLIEVSVKRELTVCSFERKILNKGYNALQPETTREVIWELKRHGRQPEVECFLFWLCFAPYRRQESSC